MILLVAYYIIAVIGYDAVAAHPFRPPVSLSTSVDELIPFLSWFAVPYVFLFYPFILGAVGYFTLVRPEKGNRFFTALFIVYAVAFITYLIFPVRMNRPEASMLPQDFLSQVIANFYRSDPPLNCFPSLHAANSTLAAYFLAREVRNVGVKAALWVVALSVVISTLFVRQHVIADVIAGVALAYLASQFAEKKVTVGVPHSSHFRVRVTITVFLVAMFSAIMIYPLLPQ